MQNKAKDDASAQQWKGNTFGTERMLRWLIVVLRHSPVTVWYAFAAVFDLVRFANSEVSADSSKAFAQAVKDEILMLGECSC